MALLTFTFFLGGVVILAWLYLWTRQRRELGYMPNIEDMIQDVPAVSTDDAVLVSREYGQLVYINARARHWLDINGAEPDLEFVARQTNPTSTFMDLFSREGQASFQLGKRWVEASSHRIPAGVETRTVVVMRELGQNAVSANALDLTQAMEVINRIGELVDVTLGVEQVLQTLLSIVREFVPADAGEICLWDENDRALYPRGWVGDAPYVLALAEAGGFYQQGEGISGWIADHLQPVLVTGLNPMAEIAPKLGDSGYSSFVGVPLLLGERFIGTFELAAAETGHFAQRELALLQATSNQIAIAIYNAQLYADQARRIDDMANLQQVMSQDAENYVEAVYRALNERLAQLVGADMCGILLHNEGRSALIAQLPFYGVPEQIVRHYQIPLPAGSQQRDIWENQAYWISNDIADEPLAEELELMSLVRALGLYNTVLVPMIVGDRRIGVVQVSNKKADGGFTLRDINNLRILAAQAAVVAENTRLYENEQSRETELVGLQEITHAIGAFNRRDVFYAEINERIARLMGIAMCGILLYDEDTHMLVAQPPFYGVDDTLVEHYQIRIAPGSSLYTIWIEEDYWFTNYVGSDRVVIEAGLEDLADIVGLTQTMMAALSVGGRRLGVVQVSNKLNGEDFTEKDARLLMIFAAQAAALIENARLYQEMQDQAQEAESLRRIAEMSGAILTSEDSFTPVLAEISRLMDSPIVHINVLDQHSSALVTYPRMVYGYEIDQPFTLDSYAEGFEHGVAISLRPFRTEDAMHDPRILPGYREIAEQVGMTTALVVPLAVGERSLGELGVANRGTPYTDDDQALMLAIATQVAGTLERLTLYQSTGENLSRRVQELDAISRVSAELTRTLDLDRVLDVIRQEAARATGANGGTLLLFKPRSDWPDDDTPILDRRLGAIGLDDELCPAEQAAVQRSPEPFIIGDYRNDDMATAPPQARSALLMPITYGEELIGLIHLYDEQPSAFDDRAAGFLATLATKASQGFGNYERYEEQITRNAQLRRRVEQLNQIFALGQLLQNTSDQITMLEAIADSVQQSVGFDVVVMLLYDEEAQLLQRVAQTGMPIDAFEESRAAMMPGETFDMLLKDRYRISESYFFPVEELNALAAAGDLSALATDFVGSREMPGAGAAAWRDGDRLLVPLFSSTHNLLGAMVLDRPANNLRPDRAIVEILEIFAHHASTTIENTQLYLGSIENAEHEARLNEMMEAIASTLDLEEILRSVVRGALRLLPFSQLTVALNEQDHFEVLHVTVQMDSTLNMQREWRDTLEHTALGQVYADGQDALYHSGDPVIDTFADLHARHQQGERTSLVICLVAGGERLGAMHLGSELSQAFGFNEYRPLVRRMANLAAVAIQNARLFSQAVELREFNDSVVQSIQQGIVVLDGAGRIILANNFMRQRYAWDAAAVGQDLFTYQPGLRAILYSSVQQALDHGQPQELFSQRTQEDNEALVRNFYVYPLGGPAKVRGVVLMIDDVTERARLEQDLEARARQLSALTEVSSRITASLDYSEVVALALSEMNRIIQYDTMAFWLRDGDVLLLEGAEDYEDDTIPVGMSIQYGKHERLRYVIEEQVVYAINQLEGTDPLPGEYGMRSWMGIPLVNQLQVVGVITLNKREPNFYDKQAEQAGFAFANQVAVALANAELFREAERRTQRLSLLNRVSVALVQSLDSEDILEIALREIAQTLNVQQSHAWLFERDLHVGRVVVDHPRGDKPPDQVVDLKDSAVFQHIRQTVKALVVDDVAAFEEEPAVLRALAPRALTAYVLIPMAISGQVIGAFEFEVYDGPRRFNLEQIDLGRIIANQAAIAIQNTSLLEQTLVRSRELETLLEAAQATSLTLDVQEVYRSVVELMLHALEMDDCALMMWDDVDRVVEVQTDINRYGNPDRMMPPGTTFNLNEYPAKLHALEERQVVVVSAENAADYPHEYDDLHEANDTAHMLVPLVVRDRSIGLVQLELQSDFRTFTHRDKRLAQALGAQAAIAIENARLSTETANRVEELYIINDLSQVIAATTDIDHMIEVVRNRLPPVLDVEELYLALYDARTEEITFPLAVRQGKDFEITSRHLNTDEVSHVIRTRRPLTMGSDYFSPDELRRSLNITPAEGDVKSYLGVPLIAGDEVVGVLALRDTQRTRAFGVTVNSILTTVGAQIGAAIQNARLFESLRSINAELEVVVDNRTAELQQERDRINTLYRITAELARTLDLERVLSRSLEMVAGAVHAGGGVIMQIDPATDRPQPRAVLDRQKGPVLAAALDEVHPAETLADWLIHHHQDQALVVNDLQSFEHWDAQAPGAARWRSALAVLLEINDDIQGVMILLGGEAGMFTEPHLRLVVAAANQVAAAINNSDLYYLIRDQAERLGMLLRTEQEEAEKSNAILEGIADGVMLANASGKIIRFNSAAERILDLPRDNVIGQPLSRLVGLQGGAAARWARTIEEWSRSPQSYKPGEFLADQFEMGSKVVSVHVSPVHIADDDQFLGTVSVFRDITKEVEVDRIKSEFISNVSHELRTPLTPIKGNTDLLLMGVVGPLNEQQQRFVQIIKNHAERLGVLVEDLLNISQLDTGSVKLQVQPVDLKAVLEGIVRTTQGRPNHADKALQVSVHADSGVPTIEGDTSKITQIFTNLVDNAFNYTPAGGTIEIAVGAQPNTEDRVLVTVKDSGIGIPEDFQEHVWDRFARNDEHALVMDVAGTGLGLSIARTLVNMHQGEIWFESQVGVGTTFYVALPVKQVVD